MFRASSWKNMLERQIFIFHLSLINLREIYNWSIEDKNRINSILKQNSSWVPMIVAEGRALTYRIFLISLCFFHSFFHSISTFHWGISLFYVSRIENNDGTYFLIDRRLRTFARDKVSSRAARDEKELENRIGLSCYAPSEVPMVVYDRSSYFSFGGGEFFARFAQPPQNYKSNFHIRCAHAKQRTRKILLLFIAWSAQLGCLH